jgi:hypothetical protein
MWPEGSIVVTLLRPAARLDGVARRDQEPRSWLLTARADLSVCEAVHPMPELAGLMPDGEGLFYARRGEAGWEIIGPVEANP